MKRRVLSPSLLAVAASLVASSSFGYDRVQPPDLAVGQRANLAGALASTAYGPSDVSRGGFNLPSPFDAPKDRGPLLASVFPTYDPDNGLSPWGMGFTANLQLTRWRVSGSLQYQFSQGDELTGPFGHLVQGADGDWYPLGLQTPVRVVAGPGDTFIAYHPDGSVWTFGGSARITNANGTYAWYLTQVRDSVGHVTTLTWSANASGNMFLSEVDYGGRATPQYRIALAYEPVTMTDANGNALPRFVDYRSGAPLALDQRVTTVTVSARNETTGAFAVRWQYGLSYVQETVGAAFYLSQVMQTFASGESPPPVRYTYNFKGASYATSQAVEIPELEQLFTTLGVTDDIIQPTRSAVIDADGDGNADLEFDDGARTLVYQKGSGTVGDPLSFVTEALLPSPAPPCGADNQTGCVYANCLPEVDGETIAPPRVLSQLNPTDTTVQVLTFLYDSGMDQTAVSVCSRDGVRLTEQNVDSEWDQSDLVRFVDLNADHMPDLVRVSFGRYDVLPNASAIGSAGTNAAWGDMISGTIGDVNGYPFTPDALWVSDVSGDGIPDLVGLYGDAIEVWHGLGNFQYVPTAQEFRFIDRSGVPFDGLANYKLVPADLNKDGLQDYFITNYDSTASRFIKYFTNLGGSFVEVPVAALDDISFTASAPVIATLDGSSDLSVTVTDTGSAYSITLDGPETGLMATADDGRGTVLSFQYTRGAATPGIRHRAALLAGMQVQTSGYDQMDYAYSYAQPVIHSIGQFLVGYDGVTRQEGALPAAPLGSHAMTFLNSDWWSGLESSGVQADTRLPNVTKVESKTYAEQSFQGIPYEQLTSSSAGWVSADGTQQAIDVTTYDAYAATFCPSHTTLTTSAHGTLVTQMTRANPAALVSSLHCLEGEIVETGSHADPTLDFSQDHVIARNDAGEITQIATQGASGPLVVQEVAYDGDLDPIAITVPGKGTTSIAYDAATKLPSMETSPEGIVRQITARDPLTDATLTLLTSHGVEQWNQYATCDGLERAATTWNDADGSSAQAPREAYAYSYASANHPAIVGVTALVDAPAGVYRQTTELFTAANEKLGTGALYDAGWVFDGFIARSRATAKDDRFEVMTQPAGTAFASIDFATLLGGTGASAPASIELTTKSTLGTDVATTEQVQQNVTKATSTSLAVSEGQVARTTFVNGTNPTTALLDPSGKLQLGYVDEVLTAYGYAYDALGRLRVVILPDGTHHRVDYDGYGRVADVVRDGIAQITNAYAPFAGGTTNLVALQTFASDPVGGTPAPQRSVAWTYDAAGRKLVETDTDLTSSATKAFTFFYDGASPSDPTGSGAPGLLTGVSGQGYTKTIAYRPDGKATHKELALAGFRTIDTDLAYRVDGTIEDQTIRVSDPSGAVLQTSAHHTDVDAFGRPSASSVNGQPLAAMTYDALGRAGTSTFSTGDTVAFAYDPLTRDMVGFDQTRAGGAWSGVAATRVTKNDRGFVGAELLGVGPSSVLRTYTYSPQGFLTRSDDGVAQ